MMLNRLFPLIILLAWTAGAVSPLQNPALNPVTVVPAAEHPPLELIRNGELRFAIAADTAAEAELPAARRPVTLAVAVLSEAFQRCAGVNVPVYAPDAPELRDVPLVMAVGSSRLTRELGVDPAALPPEGFIVRTAPGLLAIAGHDGADYDKMDWTRFRVNGTLHGAYDFVERFLGVRFYYPGIGTVWPVCRDLQIAPAHYHDAPEFANRHTHTIAVAMRPENLAQYPELGEVGREDWEGRYRIARASRYWAGHAPPPAKLAKAHPDKVSWMFYTDPSGHHYYTDKQHIGNYFDVSNLRFADLLLDELEKHYRTGDQSVWEDHNANSSYITFGQCDTFVAGMSTPDITRLELIPDSRRGLREGELADVYARFTNYLAQEIQRRFPGKRLSLIPYHNYVLPPLRPEHRRFPDNVDLRVCVYDFPVRVPNREVCERWVNFFKEYYDVLGGRPVASIWLYNEPRNAFVRAVAARYVADIPKVMGPYLGKTELYFDFHQGGCDWETYYSYYVMWRGLWNSSFNVDAALDEHWALLYGAAAPHVKAFYELLRERHEKVYAQTGDRKSAYNHTVLNTFESLLAQAQASVPADSLEARRLQLFARPWPKAIKEARGILAFERPQAKIVKVEPADAPRVDGNADEPVWQTARTLAFAEAMGSGEAGACPASGRLLWNSDGLYGAFTFAGKPQADLSKTIWANCNLEIFLSPGVEANEYFQYAFDAGNQIHLGQRTMKPVETPFDSQWPRQGVQVASQTGNDTWTMEFFLPWKELKGKAPADYDTWLGNFISNRLAPAKDYTSFSMTLGNNHRIEQFGFLKFMGKGDR